MNSNEDIAVDFTYLLLGIGLAFILLTIYLLIRLSKSEKKKKETESKFEQLETLESKLNPHLFKNILNSIQSHAYQAYFGLDKLANVLDYMLYESRNRFVTPTRGD